MKLLFYRYGSIMEPDCIDGFRSLGFTVLEMKDEISDKTVGGKDFVSNVTQFLDKNPVSFVFTINFFPLMAEVCHIYRLPYLAWTVDSPVLELFSDALCYDTNHVFIFDRGSCLRLSDKNPGHIHHLPLGCNPSSREKTFRSASDAQRQRFCSDIAFVGSLYTEKNPYARFSDPGTYLHGYLTGVMEAQLKLPGGNFLEEILPDQIVSEFTARFPGFFRLPYPGFLSDRYTMANLYLCSNITVMERDRLVKLLSSSFDFALYTGSSIASYPNVKPRGLVRSLEEMPIIFHESKISLNTTTRGILTGLPLRIFDILSAGGFCMTNYQEELQDELIPGEHLVAYCSPDELKEKCAYYLSHEKERKEIAENAFSYVSSHCTMEIRLTKMLEVAFQI